MDGQKQRPRLDSTVFIFYVFFDELLKFKGARASPCFLFRTVERIQRSRQSSPRCCSLSLLDLYGESLTTTKTANKPSRSDTMICARRASLSPFPFAWVPVTYLTQRKEREPVATKEKEREKWEDQRKTAPYWLVLLFCSREIGDDLRPSLWMSLHFLFPFAYSLWYLVRDCYVSFRFNLAFDILNAGPFTHQDVTRKGSKTSKQLQRRGKEAPFRASVLLLIQSATKKSVAWSNCVCSFSLF